jgi:hypothetical protein
LNGDLEAIVAAVEASPDLHDPSAPATPEQLDDLESALHVRLPAEFRAMYGVWNGAYLVDGNLVLYSAVGSGSDALPTASDWLRDQGWPIPPELMIIGNNGSESQFGLWLPALTDRQCPVVELVEPFESESMAVAGTSLLRFMRSWLAYYLIVIDESRDAVVALGVPEPLRELEPDEELLALLRRWADPRHPEPDEADALHDAAAIGSLLSGV